MWLGPGIHTSATSLAASEGQISLGPVSGKVALNLGYVLSGGNVFLLQRFQAHSNGVVSFQKPKSCSDFWFGYLCFLHSLCMGRHDSRSVTSSSPPSWEYDLKESEERTSTSTRRHQLSLSSSFFFDIVNNTVFEQGIIKIKNLQQPLQQGDRQTNFHREHHRLHELHGCAQRGHYGLTGNFHHQKSSCQENQDQ